MQYVCLDVFNLCPDVPADALPVNAAACKKLVQPLRYILILISTHSEDKCLKVATHLRCDVLQQPLPFIFLIDRVELRLVHGAEYSNEGLMYDAFIDYQNGGKSRYDVML